MSVLHSVLLSTRPKQWIKNLVVFLALMFTANQYWSLADPSRFVNLAGRTLLAFVLFCLTTGSVYLINDVVDIKKDQEHPTKRFRPLPSGKLKVSQAIVAAVCLILVSGGFSFWLETSLGFLVMGYFLLMLAYSYLLKHIVIIDVFTIAAGFMLRVVAGAAVIQVPISPWLYICTILGALFLGFTKRRHELVLLNDDATRHRPILEQYTPGLLEQMIAVVTPSTVIAYSLYTFSAENLPKNHAMMLTIPFVLYGVFRYLYLVHTKNQGGSPEEALLRDVPLMVNIALWVLVSVLILLVFRHQ